MRINHYRDFVHTRSATWDSIPRDAHKLTPEKKYHIVKVQALIRCMSDEADHKQSCNFDLLGPIKPFVCAEKGNREPRSHGDRETAIPDSEPKELEYFRGRPTLVQTLLD